MTDKEALKIMQEFYECWVDVYEDPVWEPEQVKAFDIILKLAARYIDLEE
mgnify:CR=1 FL=1